MKIRGFTLIELMIVVAIIGIVAAIAIPVISGASGNTEYSYGLNGLSETRCVSGYKFVVGQRGYTTQILDANGKGIPCH